MIKSFRIALFFGLALSCLALPRWGFAQGTGATNIVTNDVSVGPAATLIVAQRITVGAGRSSVTIVNPSQAVSLCIGNAGVTAGTGLCLAAVAGASVTLNTTAAIYGVWSDASTHTVSFVELF